ncbi:TraR/DksA family transcriptional regulator [Pseudomonas baetica]|uniref:TraR/DksA family transcriptional regulator n=1 Tax=Pseudomonas baetica TaxID=674054 RepID=UPI002405F060|nr:RNA polymerase-binding protein DksA [Pseudomonas baetica]MDF9778795.1 DnaK suppressor protein [Pseudomonas baetica]
MILDEKALLAQPESSYMSSEQLAFFKNLLQTKRSELIARIGERETSLSVSEQVPDAADAGSIEEERNLTMGLLLRERAEMKAIEKALARIDDDDYGWCVTGEPIGLRRLLLHPTAALCVEEQTRLEQTGRHVRSVAA